MSEGNPQRESTAYTVLAAIITVMYAGPLFGLLGTVISMIRAFSTLSQTGHADPNELAGHMSVALLTTMWGLIFSLVGFVMIFFLHHKLGYRSQWFYNAILILSGFICLFFPIGTVIGGIMFFKFYRKRSNYFQPQEPC